MGAIAKAWRVLREHGLLYPGRRPPHMNRTSDIGILIVDDDSAIRETLADILYEEGYVTIQAANGKEALLQLEAYRFDPPRLIMLDLLMPVLCGEDFCKEQQKDPDFAKIPVLIFSAYLRGIDRSTLPEGTHFLDKPLHINSLLPLLARLTGNTAAIL